MRQTPPCPFCQGSNVQGRTSPASRVNEQTPKHGRFIGKGPQSAMAEITVNRAVRPTISPLTNQIYGKGNDDLVWHPPEGDLLGVPMKHGAILKAMCDEHGRFYTFAGTTNGLRYDRPSKLLASGSARHVSVWASKRRARPVRNAMFPRWHIRVLLCPSSISALGRLTLVPDEFLMQSMKLR